MSSRPPSRSTPNREPIPESGGPVQPELALEGLSEALANEVAGHGLAVTLVEPGHFRTDLAGRSARVAEAALPEAEEIESWRDWSLGTWYADMPAGAGLPEFAPPPAPTRRSPAPPAKP